MSCRLELRGETLWFHSFTDARYYASQREAGSCLQLLRGREEWLYDSMEDADRDRPSLPQTRRSDPYDLFDPSVADLMIGWGSFVDLTVSPTEEETDTAYAASRAVGRIVRRLPPDDVKYGPEAPEIPQPISDWLARACGLDDEDEYREDNLCAKECI